MKKILSWKRILEFIEEKLFVRPKYLSSIKSSSDKNLFEGTSSLIVKHKTV